MTGPAEDVPELAKSAAVEDARERVLRTAYDLFRRHGLTVVGVDRIIAEAGVAKTTLYRHFRSKNDLIVAVLDRHEQVWTRDWLAARLEADGRSTEERILGIFDAFGDWFAQESFEGCLFTNSLVEVHDRGSPVRERALAALVTVNGLLRGLAEEAGVHDPHEFADQLQALMWGAIVARQSGYEAPAELARKVAVLMLEAERR